jgi:hypothetical protein
LYDRRVDELEGMVKNLTAQTHHFNARYEADQRSAVYNIEQLRMQLASESGRHQAAVARIDELVAENSHYKSVNEAMKMEAQEYLVKVKLDVATAAFEHRKAMDARATTVAFVQERFDKLEIDSMRYPVHRSLRPLRSSPMRGMNCTDSLLPSMRTCTS